MEFSCRELADAYYRPEIKHEYVVWQCAVRAVCVKIRGICLGTS